MLPAEKKKKQSDINQLHRSKETTATLFCRRTKVLALVSLTNNSLAHEHSYRHFHIQFLFHLAKALENTRTVWFQELFWACATWKGGDIEHPLSVSANLVLQVIQSEIKMCEVCWSVSGLWWGWILEVKKVVVIVFWSRAIFKGLWPELLFFFTLNNRKLIAI